MRETSACILGNYFPCFFMAISTSLSIKDAWNVVPVDERLELLARAQAEGLLAGGACLLMMGAIGYGFDIIWILAGGAVGAILVFPLFSSYSWRRTKPKAILEYLAARSVARRYAYEARCGDFDVVLMFKGLLERMYATEEEKHLAKQRSDLGEASHFDDAKEVWIVLMRGALAILSERYGGAKLEFLSPIAPEMMTRKAKATDPVSEKAVIVVAAGAKAGQTIALTSKYPASLYVFEKQLVRLVEESVIKKQLAESVRVADVSLLS